MQPVAKHAVHALHRQLVNQPVCTVCTACKAPTCALLYVLPVPQGVFQYAALRKNEGVPEDYVPYKAGPAPAEPWGQQHT